MRIPKANSTAHYKQKANLARASEIDSFKHHGDLEYLIKYCKTIINQIINMVHRVNELNDYFKF